MTVAQNPRNSVRGILQHHDRQLADLTGQMGSVRNELDKLSNVLYTIRDQIVAQTAQGQRPGLKEILSVAWQGIAVVGALSTAIIYIVSSQVTPELTGMKVRLENAQARILSLENEKREVTLLRALDMLKAREGAPPAPPSASP